MKKKFFLPAAVILVSLATSFMASATSEDFTVHLPSWGGDVNCSTLAKSTDEQKGVVTPKRERTTRITGSSIPAAKS